MAAPSADAPSISRMLSGIGQSIKTAMVFFFLLLQAVWVKPHFMEMHPLNIPGGSHVKVKTGTQIIDRFRGQAPSFRPLHWHNTEASPRFVIRATLIDVQDQKLQLVQSARYRRTRSTLYNGFQYHPPQGIPGNIATFKELIRTIQGFIGF